MKFCAPDDKSVPAGTLPFVRSTLFLLSLLLTSTNAMARGMVIDEQFSSAALGVSKSYRVYLPAEYTSDEKLYPVIYLLHGWGANERTWTETLKVYEVADRLDLQALIVMPDGDRSLYANAASMPDYDLCMAKATSMPNPTEPRVDFCVKKAMYEDYIVQDLVGEIDSNFKTINSRTGRALTGESAGGTGAFSLALRHPDVFSSVASHSGILAFFMESSTSITLSQAATMTGCSARELNAACDFTACICPSLNRNELPSSIKQKTFQLKRSISQHLSRKNSESGLHHQEIAR